MKNVKKIIIYSCFVVLTFLFICTTIYYRSKYNNLVQSNIQQSELVRERAEQYEQLYKSAASTNNELRTIITRAASTNNELGNCLQRSIATVAELREQIRTVEEKYKEMEDLLNSIGDYNNNFDINNDYSYNDSEIKE